MEINKDVQLILCSETVQLHDCVSTVEGWMTRWWHEGVTIARDRQRWDVENGRRRRSSSSGHACRAAVNQRAVGSQRAMCRHRQLCPRTDTSPRRLGAVTGDVTARSTSGRAWDVKSRTRRDAALLLAMTSQHTASRQVRWTVRYKQQTTSRLVRVK